MDPQRKRRLDQPLERGRTRRPRYDPEFFGAMSERVARYIGSWAFIAWMTVVVVTWIGWNVLAPGNLKPDIYPFLVCRYHFQNPFLYCMEDHI